MDPETPCKRCGHERKWHDPCTPCELKTNRRARCKSFVEPDRG